jgi:transcriptional regulator with XRE-family HTH domain
MWLRRHPSERHPHFMRQWRQSIGLTQKQMVAEINRQRHGKAMTPSYLSRIETGEREYRQDILEAYANVIGCTPADLVGRSPSDPVDMFQELVRIAEEFVRSSKLMKKLP